VAFVDRKPTDRGDVGDLYIVRAGEESARRVARANPKRGVFYGSPAPRTQGPASSAPAPKEN
jgi:hypothetical protein